MVANNLRTFTEKDFANLDKYLTNLPDETMISIAAGRLKTLLILGYEAYLKRTGEDWCDDEHEPDDDVVWDEPEALLGVEGGAFVSEGEV